MAKKYAKTPSVFPREVFVSMEDADDDEPYMIVDASIDVLDNGVTVGVYELVEVRTVVVTRELRA